MGVLDSIERGLERAVNTAFAKTFKSGVQPVEIATALKKRLDVETIIVDRDRILAPNRFQIDVSQSDYARLSKMRDTLERELRAVVTKHAKQQGYQFAGEVDVELSVNPKLSTGVLEILANSVEGSAGWSPVINIAGRNHSLVNGTTYVGRDPSSHIRLNDNGASRRHLEIIWDGKKAIARDLGSTNGSKVNGQHFKEVVLTPNTQITIGQTVLTYQLVPSRQAGNTIPGSYA